METMTCLEAAQRVEMLMGWSSLKTEYKDALHVALEALRGNPCAVCVHQPPVAGYGKPCVGCPAIGIAIKEEEE